MSEKNNIIKVQVQRGSKPNSATQEFEVPEQDNQTVLDLVTYIQEFIDPTVSYRFACRVGILRILWYDGEWRTSLDLQNTCKKSSRKFKNN